MLKDFHKTMKQKQQKNMTEVKQSLSVTPVNVNGHTSPSERKQL